MNHKYHLIQDWKELQKLKEKNKAITIKSLFNENKDRAKQYTVKLENLTLDFSRNYINQEIFENLIGYLDKINLSQKIQNLYNQKIVNLSENLSALHVYLRNYNNQETKKNLEYLNQAYNKILSDNEKSQIDTVVNIGIGGSHLGPELLYQALAEYLNNDIKCYFVSNIDPENILEVLKKIDPKRTIFMVSSKSFSTDETLSNYYIAKQYLENYYSKQNIQNKFYAITANKARAIEAGFDEKNIFLFDKNIGGRYSISSAIALPFIVAANFEIFKEFLDGMNYIDEHFINTQFKENIPAILAILDFWYINFYNFTTKAIIPYSYNLKSFPSYMQQLTMESNGKSVDNENNRVLFNTSNIIWGGMGTDVQHSFFQLLHQGTNVIPTDFIIPLNCHYKKFNDNSIKNLLEESHKKLVANAFAQIETLATGYNNDINCKAILGNKPSNTLLLDKISPKTLGMLVAIYEHKVFTLSAIWNINPFDQFGVERGKLLANDILQNENKNIFTINNLINYIS